VNGFRPVPLACFERRAHSGEKGRLNLFRLFAPLREYDECIRNVGCIDAYLLCHTQQQRLLCLLVIQNAADRAMVDVRAKFVVKRLLPLTHGNYENHDELKYIRARQQEQKRVRV